MLKPVYALVGSDPFLQLQEQSRLAAEMPPDAQKLDLDGDRAALADVLDELRSFAMFGSGKLVVLRDADEFVSKFREQLEHYVAKPADSATLILRLSSLPATQRIHKLIAKTGQVIKCEPPSQRELPNWISNHAKSAHKVAFDPDAARLLADRIGLDLGRLDTEIAKLAIQCSNGKVAANDVAVSVAFQREQQMWDMTGALASGHPAEALRRWRQLVASDSSAEFRAVTWLSIWLENARKALALRRKGMNAFTIGQELRIWPAENREPFLKTVERLGEPGLARAVDMLVEVDRQSKSGIGDAVSNVERFLLSVGA